MIIRATEQMMPRADGLDLQVHPASLKPPVLSPAAKYGHYNALHREKPDGNFIIHLLF